MDNSIQIDRPDVSVVCPFYNEELLIERSLALMVNNLSSLGKSWELIVVNDGSKDQSVELAKQFARQHPHVRVLSYDVNQGRGHAIRAGVSAARADIVVTTEIDSSWGDDIVHRLTAAFEENPDADIIVASPHLPGGGYKNVPKERVLISSLGNVVLRASVTRKISMYTGMTRAYKRDRFLRLPLDENEKEMHLEVLAKAISFDYKIIEIPSILEWRDKKLCKAPEKKRKSAFNVTKLIRTHLVFGLTALPFRYIYMISVLTFCISAFFFMQGIWIYSTGGISIYDAILASLFAVLTVLFIGFGLVTQILNQLRKDVWKIRSHSNDTFDVSYEEDAGTKR